MNEMMFRPESNAPKKQSTNSKNAVQKLKAVIFAKKNRFPVTLGIMIVLCFVCLSLFFGIINKGSAAMVDSYQTARQNSAEEVKQSFKDTAYSLAMEKYYTKNDVIISVSETEHTQKLHVLTINHTAFITTNRNENADNVTSWIEARGQGTYKVDLKAAEFIVDQERCYVLVRIPYPQLEDIVVNEVERLWFKDDAFNASYSEGVDLAIEQRNEAKLEIQNALMTNQDFYKSAQNAARRIITNLVKNWNPEVYNLTVEVEFVD